MLRQAGLLPPIGPVVSQLGGFALRPSNQSLRLHSVAKQRCKGIKVDGERCKLMLSDPPAFCHHHLDQLRPRPKLERLLAIGRWSGRVAGTALVTELVEIAVEHIPDWAPAFGPSSNPYKERIVGVFPDLTGAPYRDMSLDLEQELERFWIEIGPYLVDLAEGLEDYSRRKDEFRNEWFDETVDRDWGYDAVEHLLQRDENEVLLRYVENVRSRRESGEAPSAASPADLSSA